MVAQIRFKGVFTISEHLRILGELKSIDTVSKHYNCEVYKYQNSQIRIDLKENKNESNT